MSLSVISLFTGTGGLDFGFEAAGFRTAVAVDLDPLCCQTIRRNRRWPVLEGDIAEISSEEILRAARLREGEADVLIGGPPCQPFSKSGYWATGDSRRLSDPRAKTLDHYLRVLRDTRPKAFLLENVRGLAYAGKSEGQRRLIDGIEQINREIGTTYRVSCKPLNAADFGVPQMRERVFLVGSRDGASFEFPRPTHGVSSNGDTHLEPYHTAWDAIGDLPDEPESPSLAVGGKWGGLLPTIPEGANYLWHTHRGGGVQIFGWRRRYWSFLLKLAKDRPSWTIQAQPGPATGPFHWSSRRLSTRELCRLQTFPDDVKFDCSHREVQRMIGNAVPSLLAEILAWEIRVQLLGSRRRRRSPKLLPPRRGLPPAAEIPQPLPGKYKRLVGEHPDHPGTGKGPLRKERDRVVVSAS